MLQCLLHYSRPLFNEGAYRAGDFVWQQIRNPDQTTQVLFLGKNLHGCIVVLGEAADGSISKAAKVVHQYRQLAPGSPFRSRTSLVLHRAQDERW
jgi:hypothetical protein